MKYMQTKSWVQKLAKKKGLPKKVKIEKKMEKTCGKGTMIIPLPSDVDRMMRKAKKGKILTIEMIRDSLAKKYKTNTCCPLTTGIFAWIAANAAEEQRSAGRVDITPYWRTIKSDGSLNPKYPGGDFAQARKLKMEGHIISRTGKKFVLKNFENKKQKL
ncbi:MAG: hypothetical protein WC492_00545 [Candidatus Micrarchaeia archaeon]